MANRQFEQAGKAVLGPELSPAFEAVLKLRALRLHGTASDGQSQLGGAGIVHVVPVVFEIGVGRIDRAEGCLVMPRRVHHEFR